MSETLRLEAQRPLRWYQHLRWDFRRYIATHESLFGTLLSQGFWAGSVYRISRAWIYATPQGLLRKLVRVLCFLLQKMVEILTGISIPPDCEIGRGIYIGHHGASVLPSHGRIGDNCNLGHCITLGLAGTGGRRGAPVIGNRVFIGAHAIVVGNITVGDDAMICAGAVVTRSVPPRAVMLGNPARAIGFEGSFDHVEYDGMLDDPARNASLQVRYCAAEARAAEA